MAWVVDTCVLIDVLEADPDFGEASARLLDRKLEEGLLICPVSYVELAPAFGGNALLQDEFLSAAGVNYAEPWTSDDTSKAHHAWGEHLRRRKAKGVVKRPVADILIGAFASRHAGLITRNGRDFLSTFPALRIVDPVAR